MALIVKELQTHLEAQSGITNLVGTRIYSHHLRRDTATYPLITHQLVGNDHEHMLSGAAGIASARFQIDCWGLKMSDVEALAEQVRLAMQGYQGTMGSTCVKFTLFLNEFDLSESPKDASEQWLYRRVLEFQVKYAESIPS